MDPITKYHQLEFRLYTDEIDIDGQCDRRFNGIDRPQVIQYLGKARKQNNGKWTCLANVGGALCLVEVAVTEKVKE